jgi:gliding motility-associated-like protein
VSGSVPGYNYLWNTSAVTEDITNLSLATYSVDITDLNSCAISDSVTLTEPTPLILTFNFAHDTCYREVGMAEAIVSGGVLLYNYLWSNNEINPVINNLPEGNYSIIITDANNCVISEQLYINSDVIENPIAEFNVIPNLSIHHLYEQMDNPIFFIDKSVDEFTIITKWFWEFEDGFSSNEQDTRHAFADTGDFNVTLAIENLYGCVDTITKRIIVEEFLLYIPNSFTPNGDEINDSFLPKGIGVNVYELKIYSRWGEHFFTSNDLNIGWNGTTYKKDEIAQVGVYVYLINVIDIFGQKHTYNGQVTLIK